MQHARLSWAKPLLVALSSAALMPSSPLPPDLVHATFDDVGIAASTPVRPPTSTPVGPAPAITTHCSIIATSVRDHPCDRRADPMTSPGLVASPRVRHILQWGMSGSYQRSRAPAQGVLALRGGFLLCHSVAACNAAQAPAPSLPRTRGPAITEAYRQAALAEPTRQRDRRNAEHVEGAGVRGHERIGRRRILRTLHELIEAWAADSCCVGSTTRSKSVKASSTLRRSSSISHFVRM